MSSRLNTHIWTPKRSKGDKKNHLKQIVRGDTTLFEFVSQHRVFEKLAKKDKIAACLMLEVVKYDAADKVLKRGDHGDRILIITSGSLVEYKVDPQVFPDDATVGTPTDEVNLVDSSMGVDSPNNSKNFKNIPSGEVYGITSLIHKAFIWPNNVYASDAEDTTTVLVLKRHDYLEAVRKHKVCIHYIRGVVQQCEKVFYSDCLRKLTFFAGFPNEFFEKLSNEKYFKFEALDEYTPFIAKGDIISEFFVLLTGELVVADRSDERHIITEYGRISPKQFFGVVPNSSQNFTTSTRKMRPSSKKNMEEAEESLVYYRTLKKSTIMRIDLENLKSISFHTPTLENILNTERMRIKIAERHVNSIPLFSKVSTTWKQYLEKNLKLSTYQPGFLLSTEGVTNKRRFYIIVQGAIDVSIKGKYVRTLTKGQYLGERSILSDSPSTATLTISSKGGICKCLVMSGNAFLRLLDYEPSVRAELMFKIDGNKCSFQYLVEHPYLKKKFLKFVKKEQADETIHFLERVAELEHFDKARTKKVVLKSFGLDVQAVKSKKVNLIRSLALNIYNEFFTEDILNLSSDIRREIEDKFQSNDYGYTTLFSKAKSELLKMLDFDKYDRFKKTDVFKEFLQGVGVYI